ncbi:MAG TPA: DinB family protein [Sphingobacteriaceae bacterium]
MQIHPETLNRFGSQHKIIKHYIDDLPPEAIHNRLDPVNWSIHETIAYLVRYQNLLMDRLHLILEEIDPYFSIYQPQEDPEFRCTAAKTTGSLLHQLYRVREELLMMLEKMKPEQFARVGTHARLGRMNIPQWIEFFLLHEATQLFKIFKLAGSFWSMDNSRNNIIYLSNVKNVIDDLAG